MLHQSPEGLLLLFAGHATKHRVLDDQINSLVNVRITGGLLRRRRGGSTRLSVAVEDKQHRTEVLVAVYLCLTLTLFRHTRETALVPIRSPRRTRSPEQTGQISDDEVTCCIAYASPALFWPFSLRRPCHASCFYTWKGYFLSLWPA
jgi:hypothetical protein